MRRRYLRMSGKPLRHGKRIGAGSRETNLQSGYGSCGEPRLDHGRDEPGTCCRQAQRFNRRSRARNTTQDEIVMTAEELGQALDDDIAAQLRGPAMIGRGKSRREVLPYRSAAATIRAPPWV